MKVSQYFVGYFACHDTFSKAERGTHNAMIARNSQAWLLFWRDWFKACEGEPLAWQISPHWSKLSLDRLC